MEPERSELWHLTQKLIAEHGEQHVHNLAVEAEVEHLRRERGELKPTPPRGRFTRD